MSPHQEAEERDVGRDDQTEEGGEDAGFKVAHCGAPSGRLRWRQFRTFRPIGQGLFVLSSKIIFRTQKALASGKGARAGWIRRLIRSGGLLRPPAFGPGNGLSILGDLDCLKWLLALTGHQPDQIGAAHYAEPLVKMGREVAATLILFVTVLGDAERLGYLPLRKALRLPRGLHALGKQLLELSFCI